VAANALTVAVSDALQELNGIASDAPHYRVLTDVSPDRTYYLVWSSSGHPLEDLSVVAVAPSWREIVRQIHTLAQAMRRGRPVTRQEKESLPSSRRTPVLDGHPHLATPERMTE